MAITDVISGPCEALRRSIAKLNEPAAERRAVIAILGLAALARIAVAAAFPMQEFYIEDSDSYMRAAQDILAGRLIRSDIMMPGYPALLALAGANPLTRLGADVLLSLAGVWCLIRLTQVVSGDRLAGLFAGLIWALYPFAIFYTLAGLTETLFVTLLLAGFLGYYRKAYTLGSLAMVAAIITRPLVELLAPILVLAFALVVHREPVKRALKHVAVLLAIYLVVMTPWWIHNYAKYGSFVRLNLATGLVLYAGNNPMNRSGGVEAGVDYDVSGFKHISDPVAWDRALREAAVRFLVEQPRRAVELAGLKLQRL